MDNQSGFLQVSLIPEYQAMNDALLSNVDVNIVRIQHIISNEMQEVILSNASACNIVYNITAVR